MHVDGDVLLTLLGDLAGRNASAGLTDPDEVREPSEDPYVTPGDLRLLGDHRVQCGDTNGPSPLGVSEPASAVARGPEISAR